MQQPPPPAESQQQLLANDAAAFAAQKHLRDLNPHSPEADRPQPAKPLAGVEEEREDLFEEAEEEEASGGQPVEGGGSASSAAAPSPEDILARVLHTLPTVVTVDPKAAAAVQPGAMAGLAV